MFELEDLGFLTSDVSLINKEIDLSCTTLNFEVEFLKDECKIARKFDLFGELEYV